MINALPASALIDAVGVCHGSVTAPARIVCLVPSITELLFELGLADQVVGRTHFCIHPAERVSAVVNVGGTKKIKHRVLKALNATHVIVNIDENPKAMAEQIASYVPHVIVTHPLGPQDNPALYRLIGGIFRRGAAAEALCQRFTEALESLALKARYWPRRRVLYLIWRKPWMTVARDTYISRTLALVGWETLPAVAESRYPTLDIDSTLLNQVDLVLFSTEPYRFKPHHLEEFASLHGCPPERLALIDGEMTSWYGSRAIAGLEYLCRFAAAYP